MRAAELDQSCYSSMHPADLCCRLSGMAGPAQRLPVALLVPEERLITTMRDDVIDEGHWRDAFLVVAPAHDRPDTTGAHPTERVLLLEQRRAGFPPSRIAALALTATRPVVIPCALGARAWSIDDVALRAQSSHGSVPCRPALHLERCRIEQRGELPGFDERVP